jgi:hypothetical protein
VSSGKPILLKEFSRFNSIRHDWRAFMHGYLGRGRI